MRSAPVLLAAIVLAAACADTKGAAVTSRRQTLADSADQIAFHGRWLITDQGMQRAQMTTDTAFFFDDNTRVESRGNVRGLFYSSTGVLDAVMTARASTYNMRTGILIATGDVMINSVDGRKLSTPYLKYDQRVNQISSDSAFVLTEPGKEMQGIGFVSDPDMNNVTVFKQKKSKLGPVELPK
ncbi:MAG: LPS export ABC transporter periplasmic protein LptC [Gemmatimonadetes bacterium]|nr:LPS export ABC transporter periplasmic protein LptC [Gemmatimonadota bacterium]MBI3566851.1 LPS export ABC transporter periplasmic protein LptC [Gemmatimonadota bacterium]